MSFQYQLSRIWELLFEKNKRELKEMNFSKQAVKEISQMKTIKFDENIAIFLERCSVEDHMQLSISFANVYENFDGFIKQIEGKGFKN